MLTEQHVIEIYKYKLDLIASLESSSNEAGEIKISVRGRSAPLSKLYGVSPRTIRDIWNRQTWGYATSPLWHYEQTIRHMDHKFPASILQVRFVKAYFGPAAECRHCAAAGCRIPTS